MKRVCGVLAATAVLGLIISGTIFADEYGDFSYTVREDNTIAIDGYSGQDETVTVPDQIDGKTVVRIESNAFEYSGICSLSLPSTITEIGSNVFYGCEI